MPNDLAHPAPEDLAAYAAGEAGDLDRARRGRIASHLAGCQACSAEAEAIEAVTGDLSQLDEPELPPGFHDRLMAAVQAELDDPQPLPDQVADATVTDLGAARRRRGVGGRTLTWGAVAAAGLLVAVIGVTQLQDQSGQDAGGATVAAPAPPASAPSENAPLSGSAAGGDVPLFRLPGELNLNSLRSAVGTQPALSDAYQNAARAEASADQQGAPESARGQAERDTAAPAGLEQCLATAGPGARPAFFVEGTYQGRPVTILVAVEAQGRIGVYVFGRGDCTTLIRRESAAPPPTRAP